MRKVLLGFLALPIFLGTTSCSLVLEDNGNNNSLRIIRYSEFVEAIQDKEIKRVLISPEKGTAQVVKNDGTRVFVNLAPDKGLLQLLTDNEVDIAVQPKTEAHPPLHAPSSIIGRILNIVPVLQ
tara:strand:- start:36 stop:407 length:372 start_codon:yes stop_codon:yes gene_type:complete